MTSVETGDDSESTRTLRRDALRFAQRFLWSREGDVARQYLLEERRIDPVAAIEARVGFVPRGPNALVTALVGAGHAPDAIERIGLARKVEGRSSTVEGFPRGGGYLVIPIESTETPADSVGGFVFRAVPALVEATIRHMATALPHGALFGSSRIFPGTTRVLLVEGVIDVLSVWTARLAPGGESLPPALAQLGAELTPEKIAVLAHFGATVGLMHDEDETGRRAVIAAGQALAQRGIPVEVIRMSVDEPGTKVDANRILQRGGVDALRAVLDRAPEPLIRAHASYFVEEGSARNEPLFAARGLLATARALGTQLSPGDWATALSMLDLPSTLSDASSTAVRRTTQPRGRVPERERAIDGITV